MGTLDDITKAERLHLAALELKKHNHCREKHDLSYFREYAELQHLLKQPDVDLQEVARLAEEMKDHCQEISLGSKHASKFAVEVVEELIPSNEIAILDEMAVSLASKQHSDWESKKSLPTSKEDEVIPSIASEEDANLQAGAESTCSVDQNKSNRARRVTKDAATTNDVDSQIEEDVLLEEAIKLAAAEREKIKATTTKNDKKDIAERCFHGWAPSPNYMEGEIRDFEDAIVKEYDATDDTLPLHERFQIVYETTKIEYAEVWNNIDKLQSACSFFLLVETDASLLGEPIRPWTGIGVLFVSFFEQFSASKILKTQASCNWGKVEELAKAVEQHTRVSFLRKRIPCKCLDERYKEVKSTPKMGICFNEHCSQTH